jgi:hypothetical protein
MGPVGFLFLNFLVNIFNGGINKMYTAVVVGKLNLICTVFSRRFEIEMGFSREVKNGLGIVNPELGWGIGI